MNEIHQKILLADIASSNPLRDVTERFEIARMSVEFGKSSFKDALTEFGTGVLSDVCRAIVPIYFDWVGGERELRKLFRNQTKERERRRWNRKRRRMRR